MPDPKGAADVVHWNMVSHSFADGPMSPLMALFIRGSGGPGNERGYTQDELALRITALEAAGETVPRYYRLAMSHFRNEGAAGAGEGPFEGW